MFPNIKFKNYYLECSFTLFAIMGLRKCKQYCAYGIILMSFLAIFQSHTYFFIINKKPNLLSMIKTETNSNLLLSLIDKDRSRILNGRCNHSDTSIFDIKNYTSTSLIRAYPWLNAAIFPLQSKSLMYCAVPKIASKTLVSLIMYVYVRDIMDYLNNNNNSTIIDVNRTQIEQLIDIPKLIVQLQKV